MMKRLLAATGLVACMTTGAIAQDNPADYGVAVKDVVKGDLNGDGIQDEVILVDANCQDDLCPWVVLIGGTEGQIHGGSARQISGTTWSAPTNDGVEQRAAVVADNITWGIQGGAMFPVNDLIGVGGRLSPGLGNHNDAEIISDTTPFGPQDPDLMQVWRGDILSDAGHETVVVIPSGGSPMVGAPWAIIASGKVVAYGWSLDWPRIYKNRGGASVISIAENGMLMTEIR